jgi:hypothetical protein
MVHNTYSGTVLKQAAEKSKIPEAVILSPSLVILSETKDLAVAQDKLREESCLSKYLRSFTESILNERFFSRFAPSE